MDSDVNPEFSDLLGRARAGDVAAMVKVGNAYRNGNKRLSVKMDFGEGVSWLTKAADAGSTDAMKFLASAYARLMDAGTYFDFGAMETRDYWRERLRQATSGLEASAGTVLLGKGKKRIGRMTFQDRSDLVHIEIAPSVTSIGYSAFANCTELESVIIPPSVTSIEYNAFTGCKKLKHLNIPHGVVTIAGDAFNGCENLESVSFSDTVAEIGTDAFRDCRKLSRIDFGQGLKKLGCASFRACKSLTRIELPDSLDIIEQAVFEECSQLEYVKLPTKLERLGWSLFEGCTSLTSIALPEVKKVEGHVFKDCSRLHTVIAQKPIETFDDGVFYKCTSLEKVALPEGLKELGRYLFEDCTSLREIVLPTTVERICYQCFKGCVNLVHFEGGAGTSYDKEVFLGCEKLSDIMTGGVLVNLSIKSGDVKIPEGINHIANYAFSGAKDMTSVSFPNALESIGRESFQCCSGLRSVDVPSSVSEIGVDAFAGCKGLEMVALPDTLTSIESETFSGCNSLKAMQVSGGESTPGCCIIPRSVKTIGRNAFLGCAFESLDLSRCLESIDGWAFAKCASLVDLTVPSSVKTIGWEAFAECSSLKKLEIAYGALQGDDAIKTCSFKNCPIENAIIPDYMEVLIDKLFSEKIPETISLVDAGGAVRPWIREENLADREFFRKYGIHRYEIKYSYEPARDFWAGCRIQSPAKEKIAVLIPSAVHPDDPRELLAVISARGASKTYLVKPKCDDKSIESYSLQRDAKQSRYWHIFEAMIQYKRMKG